MLVGGGVPPTPPRLLATYNVTELTRSAYPRRLARWLSGAHSRPTVEGPSVDISPGRLCRRRCASATRPTRSPLDPRGAAPSPSGSPWLPTVCQADTHTEEAADDERDLGQPIDLREATLHLQRPRDRSHRHHCTASEATRSHLIASGSLGLACSTVLRTPAPPSVDRDHQEEVEVEPQLGPVRDRCSMRPVGWPWGPSGLSIDQPADAREVRAVAHRPGSLSRSHSNSARTRSTIHASGRVACRQPRARCLR